MAAEFQAKPFGSFSVTLPSPPPAPPAQPVPLRGFELEEPPWKNLDAHPELFDPPEQPAHRPTAIEQLMAREMELGQVEEPQPLLPPAPKLPPLMRPPIPAPDWRAEEAERVAREQAAKAQAAQDALEPPPGPEQPTYPAKPKKSVPGIL